eukprot:snap_masked-scaffold_1-processed-gene-31.12-mRNA-1 protein AED:1.00 eAED:1.00 QI:0/0/0/0/1/1/2/0/78
MQLYLTPSLFGRDIAIVVAKNIFLMGIQLEVMRPNLYRLPDDNQDNQNHLIRNRMPHLFLVSLNENKNILIIEKFNES